MFRNLRSHGPSIVNLWLAEEDTFTELLWWTKHERSTRVLVIALNRCANPPPVGVKPPWPTSVIDFEDKANRFASPERESRLEEVRFVQKYLSAIAGELAELFKRSNTERGRELFRRYASVAKEKIGDDLPNVPENRAR